MKFQIPIRHFTKMYLIAITKELTEALRKNKTIDWQKKVCPRRNVHAGKTSAEKA